MSYIDSIDSDILNKLSALNASAARWRETNHEYLPLLEALEDFKAFSHSPYWDGDLNLPILGTGQDLVRVWRALRAAGFEPPEVRPKADSSYWSGFFEKWTYDYTLRVYVTFSSTICRQVKVGTKTIEVDEYETVCEGEVNPGDYE
jgi:hypothetical protein